MIVDQITALFLALAGVAIFARQAMLSKDAETFPCAPKSVQVAMFIAGATLVATSSLFLGHRHPFAGDASQAVAVLAGVMMLYNVTMLVNVGRQRRPAMVWARLRRIWNKTCAPVRRTPA